MATHRTRALPIAVLLSALIALTGAAPAQGWTQIDVPFPDDLVVVHSAADVEGHRMFFAMTARSHALPAVGLWMLDRDGTWTNLGSFSGSVSIDQIAFDPGRQQVIGTGVEYGPSTQFSAMSEVWQASGWTRRVRLPIAGLNWFDVMQPRRLTYRPATRCVHFLVSRQTADHVSLEWTGSAWVHVPTSGLVRAPANAPVSLFASPYQGRTFGLFDIDTVTQLRELVPNHWRPAPGTPPSRAALLGLDPRSGTILVLDTSATTPTDMYEWNGSEWSRTSPLPPPRREVVPAYSYYDATKHTFVVVDRDRPTGILRAWSRPAPGGGAGSFGAGWGGTAGIPTLAAANATPYPRIGQPFTFEVTNLPASAPAFLQIGFSRTNWAGVALPLDLGFFGMPGCTLRTSGEISVPLVNVGGRATWTVPMPNEPGRTFYAQAIALDATANPRGLTLSNAWDARIER